jgi:hypothetical protein
VSEANKMVVRRLIDEVLNGGHLKLIDELYAPELAEGAKRWIAPFRASFPDVQMEIVELIAEATRSSAGSPARPPTWETGLVTRRLGVGSSGSMRCPSSDFATAGSCRSGRWRTPWGGCASSASPPSLADPPNPSSPPTS